MGTGWLVATSQIHTYDTYMILLRLGKYGHNYLGYLLIKIVMYGITTYIIPCRCGRLYAYLPTYVPRIVWSNDDREQRQTKKQVEDLNPCQRLGLL